MTFVNDIFTLTANASGAVAKQAINVEPAL
jgi:hypothetical protein